MKNIRSIVPLLLLVFLLVVGCQEEKPVASPNFLIILTDDQRPGTLGCYDANAPISTPAIDQLAREGVRFTNGFVTTPICAVSRASILTGRYATNHRVHQFVTPMEEDVFEGIYPQYLKQEGYYLGQLGKYGVGITDEQKKLYDLYDAEAITPPPFREYKGKRMHDAEWLTVRTGEFLDEVPKDQPFCLQLNYKEPHPSSEPDTQDDQVLDDTYFPRLVNDTDEAEALLPDFVRTGLAVSEYHDKNCAIDTTMEQVKRQYFEKVLSLDRSVGKIRALLKERGLDENTVIIFLSDHGTHLGEKHQLGKWSPYDESLRIPFIFYDPRNEKTNGQVLDQMVLNIDVAPTLLTMAGITPPERMDGTSLVDVLENGEVALRTHFFFEHYCSPFMVPYYIPRNVGVRFKSSKYLQWIEVNTDPDFTIEEYYDLSEDALEMKNLIQDDSRQEDVEKARQLFAEWRQNNPSSFKFDEYGGRAQFGSQAIDWDSIKVIRPERYEKVKSEIERLGIDWATAMTDWEYRYTISKNARYWY